MCIRDRDKREYVKFVNLSIDYPEDYEYTTEVLKKINKTPFTSVTLSDVIEHISDKHVVDVTKAIKLPGGVNMLYSDYMKLIDETEYVYKETYSL